MVHTSDITKRTKADGIALSRQMFSDYRVFIDPLAVHISRYHRFRGIEPIWPTSLCHSTQNVYWCLLRYYSCINAPSHQVSRGLLANSPIAWADQTQAPALKEGGSIHTSQESYLRRWLLAWECRILWELPLVWNQVRRVDLRTEPHPGESLLHIRKTPRSTPVTEHYVPRE